MSYHPMDRIYLCPYCSDEFQDANLCSSHISSHSNHQPKQQSSRNESFIPATPKKEEHFKQHSIKKESFDHVNFIEKRSVPSTGTTKNSLVSNLSSEDIKIAKDFQEFFNTWNANQTTQKKPKYDSTKDQVVNFNSFKRDVCETVFPDKSALKDHSKLQQDPKMDDIKTLQDSGEFIGKSNHKRHSGKTFYNDKKSRSKTYKAELLSKSDSFNRKRLRRKRSNFFTNQVTDDNNVCELCHRSLCNPHALYHHICSHAQYMLYSCSECQYSTCYRENVRRHIVACHDAQTAVLCSSCYVAFETHTFRSHQCDPKELPSLKTLLELAKRKSSESGRSMKQWSKQGRPRKKKKKNQSSTNVIQTHQEGSSAVKVEGTVNSKHETDINIKFTVQNPELFWCPQCKKLLDSQFRLKNHECSSSDKCKEFILCDVKG